MRNCILERDPVSGRTSMRLTGSFFDRERALELGRELARTNGEVLVDFSLVGELDDVGVATLARMLVEIEGHRISLQGLLQHQQRLFRYIGIDVDEHGCLKAAATGAHAHA